MLLLIFRARFVFAFVFASRGLIVCYIVMCLLIVVMLCEMCVCDLVLYVDSGLSMFVWMVCVMM